MVTAISPKNTVLSSIRPAARMKRWCAVAAVTATRSPGRADDARFGLQRHAETGTDGVGDAPREIEQLGAGCIAVVDQHESMGGRDTGVSVAMSLPAALIDQPCGRELARAFVIATEHRHAVVFRLQCFGL